MVPSAGFLLVIIGVSFILIHAGPVTNTKCPLNQEFKTCGTACPPTCSNTGLSQPCTLQCVAGCFCKTGWVFPSKEDKSRCVLPQDCPAAKPPCKSNLKG